MSGFPRVAWALLALLAVAAMVLTLGQRENESFPTVSSYAPSGAAAFADLLRSQGYRVTVDRSEAPRLRPDDVAVVFSTVAETPTLEAPNEQTRRFDRTLRKAVLTGTQALILPLDEDFRGASRRAWGKPREATASQGGEPRQVSADGEVYVEPPSMPESGETYTLWLLSDAPYAQAAKVGKGTVVAVTDGLPMTNRFLDRADNAEVALSLVSALAEPKARIVFAEGAFNARREGLLGTIGAWAEAAWTQVIFLFAVIVYTLGKRFGLAEERRPAQRGGRELLDAVADTQRRARHAQSALKAALDAADSRLRRALKAPQDAPIYEPDRQLPESLLQAVSRARAAMKESKLRSPEAMALCQRLEREVAAFAGERPQPAARRRRPAATLPADHGV